MAAVILAKPGDNKVLCICCTYSEAQEWAEAHDFLYTEDGCSYPLKVQDRYY